MLEAARAVRDNDLPRPLRRRSPDRHTADAAERDLERIERLGGRVVTPEDPEFPTWRMLALSQLDADEDPTAAGPLVLWVRGSQSLSALTERAVAIVGARASTAYGENVTGEVAAEMATQGWTILSDAGYGIAAAATRAALAAGGTTIAVLACGIDRPYPSQHERLLAHIAEEGLIVSEYPPGTTARKERFTTRHRILAALADGVVVAEAGLRSGTRNTVQWARRLGRPALAIPGPVTSATSAGCHRMIRDGRATLATCTDDVHTELTPLRLASAAVTSNTHIRMP
ncbi:DNA-processing protein DprA [Nocardia sp. CA-119907]|uniref:DNA-processing protein DprA n=1 Tax=Nocardia sp. CA-119907 TaxID=3239973 RepID=UPI003D98B3EE